MERNVNIGQSVKDKPQLKQSALIHFNKLSPLRELSIILSFALSLDAHAFLQTHPTQGLDLLIKVCGVKLW